MNDIRTKILNFVSKSTSAAPMAGRDIRVHLGINDDLKSDDLLSNELLKMCDMRILNTCYIQKSGWTDNYYWPTGFKGIAKSKGPEPTGIKKEVRHTAEPVTWSAIKNKHSESAVLSITNPKAEDDSMKKAISIAKTIHEAIEKTPGILHSEVMQLLTKGSTDPDAIQKAKFNIEYAMRKPGYMKRKTIPSPDALPVTTLWRTVDWEARKNSTRSETASTPESLPPAISNDAKLPDIEAVPAESKAIEIPAAVSMHGDDTDYCIKRLSEQLSDDATIVISKQKGGAILVTITHEAHIYKPNLDKIATCLSAIQTLASLQVSLPN